MKAKRIGVVVVLVLAAIGISWFPSAVRHLRGQESALETKARMKNLVEALHACAAANKSQLPPAFDAFGGLVCPASIHVHLLPFLDQQELYKTYSQAGQGKADASVDGLHAPGDPTLTNGAGVQSFAANLRVFSAAGSRNTGAISLSSVMRGSIFNIGNIPDGTSNTVFFATKLSACVQEFGRPAMLIEGGSHYDANPLSPYAAFFAEHLGERPAHPSDPNAIFQLAPRGSECRLWPRMAQSFDRQSITVGLGDGGVRTIMRGISPQTWNNCLHPNDEPVISHDW